MGPLGKQQLCWGSWAREQQQEEGAGEEEEEGQEEGQEEGEEGWRPVCRGETASLGLTVKGGTSVVQHSPVPLPDSSIASPHPTFIEPCVPCGGRDPIQVLRSAVQ